MLALTAAAQVSKIRHGCGSAMPQLWRHNEIQNLCTEVSACRARSLGSRSVLCAVVERPQSRSVHVDVPAVGAGHRPHQQDAVPSRVEFRLPMELVHP
jgi:hypothetical protein